MSRVQSFPPIVSQQSKLLILGSMPGEASHPRNAFWHIMGELFGAGPSLPYQERVATLQSIGVALWDSLQACVRPGSLDASIKEEGGQRLSGPLHQVSEHYSCVLQRQQGGEVISPSRQAGVSHVFARLPSTSPAHAAMPLETKVQAWSVVKKVQHAFQRLLESLARREGPLGGLPHTRYKPN